MCLPRKSRRSSAARARLARAAGLALVLALGQALSGACRAARPARVGAQPLQQPPPGTALPDAAVAAANDAAFQALRAALAAGEDERATRCVAALRARPLGARELELVNGAEKVLAGRALVRGLELALESEPDPSEDGRFRLVLVARSEAPGDLTLRLPPCDLKRLRATIDGNGVESLDYESRASSALRALALPPATEKRVELCTYELPIGRALAVRERWRLEPRSGEIESAGERYPAAAVRVAICERERLSPLVVPEPVASDALAQRLAADEPPRLRELLELALRTPRAEREAALAALEPVVARLAHATPQRVQICEPALRWLTQNRDLGPDASAWARYLAARVAAGSGGEESKPAGGLDLPEHPREAHLREDER